jgi:hypothetical protein
MLPGKRRDGMRMMLMVVWVGVCGVCLGQVAPGQGSVALRHLPASVQWIEPFVGNAGTLENAAGFTSTQVVAGVYVHGWKIEAADGYGKAVTVLPGFAGATGAIAEVDCMWSAGSSGQVVTTEFTWGPANTTPTGSLWAVVNVVVTNTANGDAFVTLTNRVGFGFVCRGGLYYAQNVKLNLQQGPVTNDVWYRGSRVKPIY